MKKATNSLGNSLWCLGGGLHETSLANESTRCNLFLALEVLLDGTRCLLGALHPLIYGGLIDTPFFFAYILGSFYNNRFPYRFSNGLQCLLFVPPIVHHLLLSSTTLPIQSFQSNFPFISIQHYHLFFLPLEILSTLPPSQFLTR